MKSIKRRYGFHKKPLLITLLVLVILSAPIAWFFSARSTNTDKKTNQITKTELPKTKSITSNVLFLGNTFWGRYINDWSMASPLKYKYPFSRLSEFNRQDYNAWISGLECPTSANVHMTSAEMEQALQFNCSPEYLPEASKWFTAFTLANNHTDNQGAGGFTETQQQLEKNGIQYFGHYDPRSIEDVCEVISLPVTVLKNDSSTTNGNLPVAMCGYHGVFRIPDDESVLEMKKYSPYMPVIAMPHMGAEYKSTPDELKTNFYRKLIDNGADMVIGDHPHWIQTTESYNGHLIVYSMGNFMFDQQDTPEVVRSAAIKVTMDSNDKFSLLNKWLAIGDGCKKFKDDCLSKIEKQNLKKLDINYNFGIVGTSDSEKLTKPATEVQQNDILKRLNWQTTTTQLRAPYIGM